MKMSFRWYGTEDAITLEQIRQIPGMKGIVTAIYDVKVGEVWPIDKINILKNLVEEAELEISVIESVPVHEDIKLGRPSRDKYIANYIKTLENLGECGINCVCYNFMPVFDWTRTDLEHKNTDGSSSLIYEHEQALKMDPLRGELALPGWDTSYSKEDLKDLFSAYEEITEEVLWGNLEYFIKAIMPTAKRLNIKMAIHPDDPPWDIFGLPRIIKNAEAIERFLKLYDDPVNGITFCTGSYGALYPELLPQWIREFGKRINFFHARNVLKLPNYGFYETSHLSSDGSVDMYEVLKALYDIGFRGAIRPDHGRMIWGETGRPGYGLYDRALGATYLNGIWEAINKENGR